MSEHDPLENDENAATPEENDEAQLYETVGTTSRRGFLKGVGAATGAAATGGAGTAYYGQSPVEEAEAISPEVVVGAVAGPAGAAVGWALREYTADDSDAPSDGLSASALEEQVYQTALTRQSTNQSTFVDNRNIVESGVKHAAYADGKIAAIEALNNEKQKSEVKTAATSAVDDYETTVVKNLLKSWNESAREIDSTGQQISSHSNVTFADLLEVRVDIDGGSVGAYQDTINWNSPNTVSYQLPDGSSMDVLEIGQDISFSYKNSGDDAYNSSVNTVMWSPVSESTSISSSTLINQRFLVTSPDGENLNYLKRSEWNGLVTTIESAFQSARDGIITWVDNVYDQVQAGELDTSELLTPRELAEMTASEENAFSQAVADLQALNISTNLDREAEIHIPASNATLYGTLASTQDKTFNAGSTITPSSDDADYYLTYDVSRGEGTWEAYDADSGVDGGVVTFTEEPHEGHRYHIHTTADETATVLAEDFTANDSDGDGTNDEWTVDVSDQLETSIANIDSIDYEAAVDETKWETIQLDTEFEIVTFTDTETGEEKDTATTESEDPQDDTNYITEEEWQELRERQEELIEKYEESQNSGGGAIDFGQLSNLPAWVPGAGIVTLIAWYVLDDDN